MGHFAPRFLVLTGMLLGEAAPELVVSVGHAGAPDKAAFVGKYLMTAAWSNVAVIDLASGIVVEQLPQGSLVQGLASSPRGDLVAVGTCGNSIQLWDVPSWTRSRRISLTQECAESLSFSPDGLHLATGAHGCSGNDGLQVWDVRTGKMIRSLAQGSGIRRVVFSGDGQWLAGVDDKGKARIFEWPSGRELRNFEGLGQSGYSGSAALASGDGRYFAWLGDSLRVWDIRLNAEIVLPAQRLVTVAGFLDDGRVAYVDDDRLRIRRLPQGPDTVMDLAPPQTDFFGHVGIMRPRSWLTIRRDGRWLAGSRESRTVAWDVEAGRLRELTAPALMRPVSLEWSRSGIVAWAGLASGVRGWNDRSGRPMDFGGKIEAPQGLAFRPDGARLAVSGLSSIHIIDLPGQRVTSRELPISLETGVAYSPDGSRLAFSSGQGFGLFDEELRLQKRLATLEPHTSPERVAFSPNGRWIAAGLSGPHPALRVWPVTGPSTTIMLDQTDLTYGPQPPAFSRDSEWLASFRQGRSLVVWDTSSWSVIRTWTLPGTGRALAFAPDGPRLAVAADGEAAIWDSPTGRKVVTFSTPGSAEMAEIAWSPDGKRVVSAADDGVLRFWDAADGGLLASLYALEESTDWLLVAPNGRLDGSDNALRRLVAWRVLDQVVPDEITTRHRQAPGLWSSLLKTLP